MNRKLLKDCHIIFLDTGILIDLLKVDLSGCDQSVVLRIEQTRNLFASLNDPLVLGKDRKLTFQMSAINIAEIFHLDNKHESLPKALTTVLGSGDLEIHSFDFHTALYHNSEFYNYLSKKEIQTIKDLVNYPKSLHANVEDRIRKDILIASTAKLYRSDLVLTNDAGFKTLCDKLDLFCHVMTGNNADFRTSANGQIIYDFNAQWAASQGL